MSIIRLKPTADRRVRLADGRLLPDEGMEVERDLYWHRRLADGDVVEVSAAPMASSRAVSTSKGNGE